MGKVGGERDGTSSNIVQLLALKHTKNTAHPLIGPLSGTTRVSRYRKGKTNLDFTEARDSEWQWQQLGHMQACQHPTAHFFTRWMLKNTKTAEIQTG